MSYLAIARKYRPATFDEIVGQEHVTRTLRNAIERDRIHHGFLFTGARGVGKTTAARALARALNCVEGPTPDPCGVCTSCVEVSGGRSPDLIEIDGASNNSVEDVRELRETVKYAPTAGRWKIYLVDEVHMLSKGAFNALLKTLEEPPPHVVFIFATTEPNRIPDTILSRVQRFDFKRIPVPAVVAHLAGIATKEGVTISEAALRMIARAGEGSMRDAQSLLDQVISYAGSEVADEQVAETLGLIDRSLLYDMLEGLVTGDPERCLTVIDTVYGYGFELSVFTSELLEVMRNATFCRLSPGSRKYIDVSADELGRLDAITADVAPEALSRSFTALLDVHDQVSRASRPRIVLEMAVARLATVRPVQPVNELVGRLESMERRLREGGSAAAPSGLRGGRAPRTGGGSSAAPKASKDDRPRPAPTPPARSATTARPPPPEPPKAEAPKSLQPKSAPQPAKAVAPPVAKPSEPPLAQGPQLPPDPVTPPGPPEPPVDDHFYDGATDGDPGPAPEPERGGRGRGERGPSREPTPDDRWKRFCEALRTTPAAMFAKGDAEWVPGGPLRVGFTVARQVAEARRFSKGTALDEALVGAYPPGVTLVIVDKAHTGDVNEDLLRQAKTDPDVERIRAVLGAELRSAAPLEPGDS